MTYSFFKRSFDVAFSFAGLVILSPLLLVIAALVKIDSPGPVFYRGLRVGMGGKPFRTFKFRTMVVDAEKAGGPSTADDDPRITRTGRFIRIYKIDELPQLIDVLRGTMSFVGPRPEVRHYVDMFTEQEKVILSVKPGITDWATLWNSDEGALLKGSPDPEKAYMEMIRPEKIRLQLKYVAERSFTTDIKIVFQTLAKLISR